VRGADGSFYLEVPLEAGGFGYEPAEKGLSFKELPNGKWIAVRDIMEAQRQADPMSHLERFSFMTRDGKVVRQHMKSLDALERVMRQFAVDRVSPGASPNVKQIKDVEFEALLATYQQARLEGREKECEFRPLNTYAHKLVTKSGSIVRPLLKGEVGMIKATILVLEQGYGTGNFVQVSDDVTTEKREE
jgi:hypothetical protein